MTQQPAPAWSDWLLGTDPRLRDRALLSLLGSLGFIYSGWALYGSGAETVFLGTLLIVAAIPLHVWMKWKNAKTDRS